MNPLFITLHSLSIVKRNKSVLQTLVNLVSMICLFVSTFNGKSFFLIFRVFIRCSREYLRFKRVLYETIERGIWWPSSEQVPVLIGFRWIRRGIVYSFVLKRFLFVEKILEHCNIFAQLSRKVILVFLITRFLVVYLSVYPFVNFSHVSCSTLPLNHLANFK